MQTTRSDKPVRRTEAGIVGTNALL